jgi:hypothetical protein
MEGNLLIELPPLGGSIGLLALRRVLYEPRAIREQRRV